VLKPDDEVVRVPHVGVEGIHRAVLATRCPRHNAGRESPRDNEGTYAYVLMWGSDYSHGDGVWPESSKYIVDQCSHLPPETTRKSVCESAGRSYGLIT
jgi:hypothetical protein